MNHFQYILCKLPYKDLEYVLIKTENIFEGPFKYLYFILLYKLSFSDPAD